MVDFFKEPGKAIGATGIWEQNVSEANGIGYQPAYYKLCTCYEGN